MADVVVPFEAQRRLDSLDRKILRVLQEDASLSVVEIGDRVGLSSTPCWKRIQRMEGEGIIKGRVALVDPIKIGLGLSVFVSIESGDQSDAWLKKFAIAVSAMPEVMEFYRMAGDVDYMLRVVVADVQSYDVFYKKLIGAVSLKNVTSRFAMEKIKSVTALPVLAADATLDGGVPAPPHAVLDAASAGAPSAVTWQPRAGVRIATVTVAWQGGYVLAGRSLRRVEEQEWNAELLAGVAWVCMLAAIAATSLASAWLWPHRGDAASIT